jgi:hypothetical protein
MASEHRQDIAARLQDLYRNDDIARALLDDAAERSYVVAKTSVDRIARIAGTTRAKAVELCKLLDDIGVGTYKRAYTKDTDKFPARIHWHYVPRSIGRTAKGESVELQDIRLEEPDDIAERGISLTANGALPSMFRDFIEHRYPLREGRIATLRLPTNLTKEEADRLSNFIAALAQPE